MSAPTRERIIVSVGGSLIVPDGIDVPFLNTFRTFILAQIEQGFSFAIVTGGGKTCRRYQAAASEIGTPTQTDLDWIGIYTNCMHAEFLRTLFGDKAAPDIVRDFTKPVAGDFPIIMIGAEAPGHSSDYDAVLMAKMLGAKRIANLSNIDYVYTADPRKDPEAKKIEQISWADFRALIPEEWGAGLSAPFDPVASKEAEAAGLEVAVINGADLSRFDSYLKGEPFVGTVIS